MFGGRSNLWYPYPHTVDAEGEVSDGEFDAMCPNTRSHPILNPA